MSRPPAIAAALLGVALLATVVVLFRGSADAPSTMTRDAVDTTPDANALVSAGRDGNVDATPPSPATAVDTEREAIRPLGDVDEDAPTARVVGEVNDETTGDPVEGVTVVLTLDTTDGPRSASADTTASGRFSFVIPTPATLRHARALDLGDRVGGEREMNARLDDGAIEAFGLTMRVGSFLSGVVVDENDHPVGAARVDAWRLPRHRLDRDRSTPPHQTATADGAGRYTIGPLLGPFTIEASSPRHVPRYRLAGDVPGGARYDDLVLTVAAPRRIHGRVVGPRGHAMPGVEVVAWSAREELPALQTGVASIHRDPPGTARTESDGAGGFELTVAPIRYRLTIDHPPYPRVERWHAPGDDDVRFELTEGGRLHGTVIDDAGRAIAGVTVRLDDHTSHVATTVTGPDGTYAFDGLETTEQGILHAHAAGHALLVHQPVLVDAGRATRLDVRLDAELRLAGKVVDGEGVPLAGIALEIEGDRVVDFGGWSLSPRPTWERRVGLARARTDQDGHFAFDSLYAGRFVITASARRPSRYRTSIEAAAGRTDLVITLDPTRDRGVTLRGTVRDRLTGAPIDAFRVTPMVPMPDGGSTGNTTPFEGTEGHFEIAGLTPGELWIIVSADGFVAHSTSRAEYARGDHRLDVFLAPVRTLKLRLVDLGGQPLEGARVHFADDEGDAVPRRPRRRRADVVDHHRRRRTGDGGRPAGARGRHPGGEGRRGVVHRVGRPHLAARLGAHRTVSASRDVGRLAMFLEPLGLLALLGVPAVLALHLLRRRFRPRDVSAIFLWQTRDQSPVAGPRRERLRKNPSLWLELAAAALLALLFAGFKGCAGVDARHLVAVLDASASMDAITASGPQRQRAVDALNDRIDDLPRGSAVTLIATGSPPEVLVGPSAPADEAVVALSRYRPDRPRHDPSSALDLARQIAGERAILYVTDRSPGGPPPTDVDWIAVGEATDNIAITHAARDHGRAYLTVQSFAAWTRGVTLRLLADDVELKQQTVELAPGQGRALTFELGDDAPTVEARIDADALRIDDRAWLAPPPDRTITLHTDLDHDTLVELGLRGRRAAAGIAPWLALAAPARVAGGLASDADLSIGTGAFLPRGPSLTISSGADDDVRRDLIGPFLVERRHPLLDGVNLDGVVWSVDDRTPLRGAPLVSAGNLPLLTEQQDGDVPRFTMSYDPERSTVHRSPDWPILLKNLAELARDRTDGAARTTLASGETLVYRSTGEGSLTVIGDEYLMEHRTRGVLAVDAPSVPGRYRLQRDGEDVAEIAVNLVDAAESDLRSLATGTSTAEAPPPTIQAGLVGVDLLLLSLVTALLLVDWLVLSRSRGGAS